MDLIKQLQDLEIKSRNRGIPIIGPEKGQWLLSFVKENKPQHILELGTANGYSGIILGSQGAKITTIELNKSIAKEARKNFSQFGIVADILIGDAVQIVAQMAKEKPVCFDLIFIDFSKKKYLAALESCLTIVKKGGFIIADNLSMGGCRNFKDAVLSDTRLATEIIPIKDGLSCSQKII